MRVEKKTCVIIGASHAGATCAMELRKQGWEGSIILIDADDNLPYHRPPLSKAYLSFEVTGFTPLFPKIRYDEENITLALGVAVISADATTRTLILDDGSRLRFDVLVLATGAAAKIPPLEGIAHFENIHVLRNAKDALALKSCLKKAKGKNIIVIGGGYIGLETAATINVMGGSVTILEREERLLARVASPELASFFQELHTKKGVIVKTGVSAHKIIQTDTGTIVEGTDGSFYPADIVLVGVGVEPNVAIAAELGAELENGIKVDHHLQTNVANVYAIGDAAEFYHPIYKQRIRLESVQNAVDQAKIAVSNIVGVKTTFDAVPWFWSDQFHIKLQIVGLSKGYSDFVVRIEDDKEDCFSIWYFKDETLMAVDAVNNGKAFVLGTKFIRNNTLVDKMKLADSATPFKPDTLIKSTTNVD